MSKRKRKTGTMPPPSIPPVEAGIVSPIRLVPANINKPPYALTGDPGNSISSLVRDGDEIKRMEKAGEIAAKVLFEAGSNISPGITTDKIDEIVHEMILSFDAYPSPLNYRGFPKSVCTSINEVICHGIPDSRILQEGDIVNIDVTVYHEGVHGDTSVTFPVGEISELDIRLIKETRKSMELGIEAVKPGRPVNVIGRAIERHAKRNALGVVREFIGHGVGTEFHSSLQIPHYYDPYASTEMLPGMTFTIEPMLTLGDPSAQMWSDNWTAVTRDGRRTAQFEHTILVTEHGARRLTVLDDGKAPSDLIFS
ncbi:MAG: type I methionyl aminopeptidase [Actinomycetota bacterium]|nr:type I methionyl aminopeptidase [Actinomycetota bacterium]